MMLYSSAAGHSIDFLFALDQSCVDVSHQRRWVTFCGCPAQTLIRRKPPVFRRMNSNFLSTVVSFKDGVQKYWRVLS